jgi:hypothetical protein
MTYAYPDRLVRTPDETGGMSAARVPGSPTRPARPWEMNTWWEDEEWAASSVFRDEFQFRMKMDDGSYLPAHIDDAGFVFVGERRKPE